MIRLVLTGILALLMLSCDSNPTKPRPELDIPRQDQPFYYSQGSPIYLGLDSTKIVISAGSGTVKRVQSMLATAHVQVDSVSALAIDPIHWVVHFAPNTTAASAELAAQLLRKRWGIAFASNAYISPYTGKTLLLINEFSVRFKDTTSLSEIRSLNRAVGATILRRARWNESTYILAFPRWSSYTPLEIAAYYYQQSIVVYSSPQFAVTWPPWP